MYPRPLPKTAKGIRRLYMALVLVILLIWMAPLCAIIMTSARAYSDIAMGNLWGLPTEIAIVDNYVGVFTRTKMAQFFWNSLIITVPSVIAVSILSLLSGYVLAKFRFPGNMVLFAIFIGGNFLPAQIMMIPVRDLLVHLGIYDTHLGLIIFHVAFQTGFATLFMRNFVAALPSELFEAARAEGASPWQVLVHIVFPLVRPGLAALSILLFTFIWNDYFWALILSVSDTVKPITAGLASLRGEYTTEWNIISAGTIVAALPPVVMFLLMQKHFITGLTQGAVKG